MVNDDLCTPCKAMLASEKTFFYDVLTDFDHEGFIHHANGESFRQALDARCRLCLQLWTELGSPSYLQRTAWNVVTTRRDAGDNSYAVLFQHDPPCKYRERVQLLIQPYSVQASYPASAITDLSSPARLLSNNTGSDQSFDFLQERYEECRNKHRKCSRVAAKGYVPTRLLDVGTSEQHSIFLVDRACIASNAQYVSLSHCWGNVQPMKLTSESESLLRRGLSTSSLPRTFQHALAVARRLRIRYLWIDSLCIFQDNANDWSIEAASMEAVYRNADLNVAATDAPNSTAGLFFERDPQALMPFKIDTAWRLLRSAIQTFVCSRTIRPEVAINRAPLNRRAWVMQERHLSTRIAHFTKEVLFWECCESFANELCPTSLPVFWMSPARTDSGRLKQFLNSNESLDALDKSFWLSEKAEEMGNRALKNLLGNSSMTPTGKAKSSDKAMLYAWNTFVGDYNDCQLTFASDKLVALAGVARRVAHHLEPELVAGLWRKWFIEELLWNVPIVTMPEPQLEPRPWIAPSWSWASVDGRTERFQSYSTLRGGGNMADVVEINLDSKPSGALNGGYVKLLCRLVPCLLKPGANRCREGRVYGITVRFCDPDREEVIWLDQCYLQSQINFLDNINMLMLYNGCISKHNPLVAGLVLVPSRKSDEHESFERIAMFRNTFSHEEREPSFCQELMTRCEKADDRIIKIL